jgi:predicted secreted protein
LNTAPPTISSCPAAIGTAAHHGKTRKLSVDRRNRKIALVANCLLNQNAKVAGMASWPAMVSPVIDVLSQADVGIVQLPCPEVEHLGVSRPTGEDTREQYDTPAYRACCLRLAQHVVRHAQQYINSGCQVVCVLGVEGSPSCSVTTVPTRKGPADGSGVFFEVLLTELKRADLEVPVIGIPEAADMTQALADVRSEVSTPPANTDQTSRTSDQD